MFTSHSPLRTTASKGGGGQFDLSSFNNTRASGKSQTAVSSYGTSKKYTDAVNGFGAAPKPAPRPAARTPAPRGR